MLCMLILVLLGTSFDLKHGTACVPVFHAIPSASYCYIVSFFQSTFVFLFQSASEVCFAAFLMQLCCSVAFEWLFCGTQLSLLHCCVYHHHLA